VQMLACWALFWQNCSLDLGDFCLIN